MDPSNSLSSSIDFPVIPVIRLPAPQISPRDEEGLSSCLVCPCHRAVARTPPECKPLRRSDCNGPCCLRPADESSASGAAFSRPFLRSLSLRPDGSLTILKMALSINSRVSVSLRSAIQATRLLTITSEGLFPTEHTSLYWTCSGTRCFSSSNQFTTMLILRGTSAAGAFSVDCAGFIITKRLPSGLISQAVSSIFSSRAV